jgi:hypothetical protein
VRIQTALLTAALSLAVFAAPAAASAAMTSLVNPPFSWGAYGGGLGPSRINVSSYVTPAGGAGGVIQTVDVPIYAAASGPPDHDQTSVCTGHVRCEQIGTMQFQYALWKGSQQSVHINRVGAAVMGGFQLTDPTDTNGAFSFLQTYHDYYDPNGFIDGGGYFGKYNGLIPRWSSNPNGVGWNYGANAFQYQFWDVPFDIVGISPPEVVSFETALVNYDPAGAYVNVLADFSWSFDTRSGALTGQQITLASAASPSLLSLYAADYPTVRYASQILSPIAAPEPAAWAMMLLGAALAGGALRGSRARRPRGLARI